MISTLSNPDNKHQGVFHSWCLLKLSSPLLIFSLAMLSACQKQALDKPLEDKYLSCSSLEAYFPPYRVDSMGDDLLKSMDESGLNLIQVPASQIHNQDDNGAFMVLNTGAMEVVLSEVHTDSGPSGVNLLLVFAPSEAEVDMEVSYMGQGTELCHGKMHLPSREAFVHLSLQNDSDGGTQLLVDGDPGLSGEPIAVSLDDPCQLGEYMVDKARALLSDGLDSELTSQLQSVLEELSQLSTSAFGLDMELSGKIGENLLFSVLADNLAASSLDAQDCSLTFNGGFESQRDWCVPSDISPVLASQSERTAFSDVVPGSQSSYSLAISVSLAFLRQGVVSAYRAGLLCRQATEFSLDFVDPVDLFASLGQLGHVRGMKVSTRPMGMPDVIWGRPDGDSPDSLPGVILVLPDVYMDVFISMDGLDMRALELKSNITVSLEPSLESGILSLRVAQVDVQKLDVGYNELTTERAGELRQSSIILIEQVVRTLLEPLSNISLDLPIYSGKSLLGYEFDDQHLVVYLGFSPSSGE